MNNGKKIHLPGGEYVPPTHTEHIIAFIKDPHKQNASNMISTAVMAVFTVVLSIVSIRQLAEMRSTNDDTRRLAQAAVDQARLLKETLKEVKTQVEAAQQLAKTAKSQADSMAINADNSTKQVDAMRMSAETARRSLAVTIDTFHQDQRAWIGPTLITISELEPRKTKVTIIVSNTGKTPALNSRLKLWAYTSLSTEPLAYSTPNHISQLTVFPNSPVEMNLILDFLDAQTIEAIGKHQINLMVAGQIEYEDAFREHHKTAFKAFYDAVSKHLIFLSSGNQAN